MGTLSAGIGALCAGIFGMNLTTGIENHPSAFLVTTGGIFLIAGTMFGIFANRYSSLRRDYSDAKSLHALRHFFDYVQDVEDKTHENKIDIKAFRNILEPVIGAKVTETDIESIFRAIDNNRDGFVDKNELTSAPSS